MENNEETKVVDEVKEEQSAPTQQTPAKKPGLYTAGLVCSIVGLCLFWSTWIGIICGVLGIIFGAVTLGKTNSKTPIILGSIATGLAIIMMIVYFVIGAKIYDSYKKDATDFINETIEQGEETVNDIIDDASELGEEEKEKKEAEFKEKEEEVQEDINATMDDLTKQVQDVFNN